MKQTLLMLLFAAFIWNGSQDLFAQETTPWRAQIDKNTPEKLNDIRQTFDDYWSDKDLTKIPKGYKQFKRYEDFWSVRVDETGNRPNPMHLYLEWLKYQKSDLAKSGNFKNSSSWSYVGPTTLPQGSSASYAGMGRVNAIAFNPNNTSEIWVGSPSGGLWKSTTGGTSWSVVADNLPTLGISDIVIDHSNTNTIYIATGDADGEHNYSLGVMKSIDGGATWSTTGLNYINTQTRQISRLIMHPTNSSILIAATSNGIMRTTDGGTTWTAATNNDFDTDDNAFRDVEFKPNAPNIVYAGSGRGTILKSTDNGATWDAAAQADSLNYAGWVRIAVSAADVNRVYAVVDNGSGNLYSVMRSNDSGATWTTVFTGATENLLGGQGNYDLAFAAAPSNANLIYVGGVDLYKSTDGGSNFTKVADDAGTGAPYMHGDHHTLVFEPGTNNIFVGHDGGVQKTDIATDTSWDDLSAGLFITQFYRLGLSQQNVNLVLAGAQDNDVSFFNGTGWLNQNNLSDGMECVFSDSNSNVAYTSSQKGYLQRTTDNFTTTTDITASSTSSWTIPVVLHPTDSSTIFAGYEEIYKSTDKGDNWTTITSNLAGTGNTWDYLAIPASNANTIYAASGAQLFRTTNGGTNWTAISTGLPGTKITYIATHSTNSQKLWITVGGLTANQKVYASTDGGSTWTNISGSLPNITAKCVVFHSGCSGESIYVGTDLGVFYRDTTMTDWQAFNMGLPNVIISELEIHKASGKIRAATFGRGVWEADLNSDTPDAEFSYTGSISTFCQNGTDPTVSHNTGESGTYTSTTGLAINDSTGVIDLSASMAGSYVVTNTIDAEGGCPDATHTVNVVIETIPNATFSYSNTSLCKTGSNPVLTAPSSTGGSFSVSPSGLVIDVSGNIDVAASNSGAYSVTYSVASGSCNAATHAVSVNVVDGFDAEFGYNGTSTFCQNGTDPTVSHATGMDGAYSSTTGLAINDTTGVIDLSASTAGNYVVTNTIAADGGCSEDTHTVNVVVEATPDATFSYDNTSPCKTGIDPVLTAPSTTGGTYSATPAGLTLDATSGAIDVANSTVGTYNVVYTVTTGSCNGETDSIQVNVVNGADAEFNYGSTSTFCQNGTDPTVSHTTGMDGAYSSTTGLAINDTTGVIDLSASTAGNYVVTNTIVADGGCPEGTHTVNVVVEATPDATFSYDNTSLCKTGSDPVLTAPNTTGGTYSSTPAGLTLDATSGAIDIANSTVGTYNVVYSVAAGSCNGETHSIQVNVVNGADAEFNYGSTSTFCQNGTDPTVNHTTGMDGAYSSTTGLAINDTTGVIDLSASTAGSYVVTNTIAADGGCPEGIHTVNVVIETLPNATFSYSNTSLCKTGSNPVLTAPSSTGGSFSVSPSGLVIDASGNIDVATSNSGTYNVSYSVASSSCNVVTHAVSVNVVDGFDAEFGYNGTSTFCQNGTDPTVSHTTGMDGAYSSTTGLAINDTTGVIDLSASTAGNYVITNTIVADGGCPEVAQSVNIAIVVPLDAGVANDTIEVCNTSNTTLNLYDLLTGESTGGNWSDVSAAPATGLGFGGGTTGTFNPSGQTAGTYIFRYEVNDNSPCSLSHTDVQVDILDPCCPVLGSHGLSDTLVCDGDSIHFQAVLNAYDFVLNTDYTVTWSGLSDTLHTGVGSIAIQHSGTTACNETQTYTLNVFCSNSNSIVATETYTVKVAPAINTMAINAGSCAVSIAPDCTDWQVNWDDGQGNMGTMADLPYSGNDYNTRVGTVAFTITNPNAPSGCASKVVNVDFECCTANAGDLDVVNVGSPCPAVDIEVRADSTAQEGIDYGLQFLIMNEAGQILEVSDTGVFSGYSAGLYTLRSYSENIMNPPSPSPSDVSSTPINISTIGQLNPGCYNLSAPVVYEVPESFDVPLGGTSNSDEGMIGVGPFTYNSHTIIVSGGTTPYTYNWDTEGYVVTNILPNNTLNIAYEDEATWAVTVTDANNCTNSELVFSNEPTPADSITILDIDDYTITSASKSNADGSITVEIGGGDGVPYNYYWSGGAIDSTFIGQGNTSTLNGLYSGWYSLQVEDASTGQTTLGWFWVPESDNTGGVRGKQILAFSVNIHPNPMHSQSAVQVYAPQSADYQIAVYDLNGRLVQEVFKGSLEEAEIANFNINGAELSKGLYLLEVTNSLGQRQIEQIGVVR